MSSSLSNDERAERIAVIADIERRADYGYGNLTGHVNWLCAELRSALQREAEATKDAERYRFARERFVMESERDGDSVSNDEFDAELDKEMLEWRASALLMATAAKHGYRLASEVILDCAEGSRSLPSREE